MPASLSALMLSWANNSRRPILGRVGQDTLLRAARDDVHQMSLSGRMAGPAKLWLYHHIPFVLEKELASLYIS